MDKTRIRVLLVGAGVVLVGALIGVRLVLGGPDSFNWAPPPAGTVVAQSWSPDNSLLATVIAGDSAGQYVFSLRRNTEVIARRQIAAPVGYHPQIVHVDWVPDGSRAIATIDHDFGESNVRVELPLPR